MLMMSTRPMAGRAVGEGKAVGVGGRSVGGVVGVAEGMETVADGDAATGSTVAVGGWLIWQAVNRTMINPTKKNRTVDLNMEAHQPLKQDFVVRFHFILFTLNKIQSPVEFRR